MLYKYSLPSKMMIDQIYSAELFMNMNCNPESQCSGPWESLHTLIHCIHNYNFFREWSSLLLLLVLVDPLLQHWQPKHTCTNRIHKKTRYSSLRLSSGTLLIVWFWLAIALGFGIDDLTQIPNAILAWAWSSTLNNIPLCCGVLTLANRTKTYWYRSSPPKSKSFLQL